MQNVTARDKKMINMESKKLGNTKFKLRRENTDLFRFPEKDSRKK